MKNVQDAISKIKECETSAEVRDTVMRLDELYNSGLAVMTQECWPKLTSAISYWKREKGL